MCRKIGFFFFLTVLKMEMVAENQRWVLPLLSGAWDWVTGARGSRTWGTLPWTTGKRLTPFLLPVPLRFPEAQVSPAPSETSRLGPRVRETEVWSAAWLPASEPCRRLRRPGEKECPGCPLVLKKTLSSLWKVPAPPGSKGTGSAFALRGLSSGSLHHLPLLPAGCRQELTASPAGTDSQLNWPFGPRVLSTARKP